MKTTDQQRNKERFAQACLKLIPQGWLPVGFWLFEYEGKTYDLTCADLDKLNEIADGGFFIV